MFCPNCGTKNEDRVARCGQCGFDLKVQAAPAKFKGTVIMRGGVDGPSGAVPAAPAGAASGPSGKAPANALKGTMVGVAPPDLGQMSKSQQHNAKLMKGTMVGVAPPSAAYSEEPKVSAASTPVAEPPSRLKGTMIGVAPPDMQAEIAAARAKAAQNAGVSPLVSSEQIASPEPQAPAAPLVYPSSGTKGPPSKLKGTMIGVAPPDMQAEIAAAKARYLAGQPPEEEAGPPSGPVNPLGGTVVGTSPFSAADMSDGPVEGAAWAERLPQPAHQPFSAPIGTAEDDEPPMLAGLPQRTSSTQPLLILIGLLVLAAVAVVTLLMMKSGGDEAPAESSTPAKPE